MRKVFKVNLAILAMFIAIGFVMVSCEEDGKNSGLFTDHQDYSIRIRNNSSYNLVAFASDVRDVNLIGGVTKFSGMHGFKKDTKFFGQDPNYFRMVFITEQDYKKYKGKLQEADNRVIASMFIFWNGAAGENSKVYEVAANMGGDNKFMVNNPTNFDVEIRVNGPSGPTLGFVPKGMAMTTLYCTDLEIIAFPVFLYENKSRQIIESIFPMVDAPGGGKMPARTSLNFESTTGIQTMNLSNLLGALSERKSGASYINVRNNTGGSIGNIAFVRSNVIQTTATGTRYFPDSKEFRIDMLSSGDSYQDSRTLSGLAIETGGLFYDVVDANNPANKTFVIEADKIYSIVVTGDTFANIKATIELRENETDGPIPMTFSITGW